MTRMFCVLAVWLGALASFSLTHRDLSYVGPHNIHQEWMRLRQHKQLQNRSIQEAVQVTYDTVPIMRDLNSMKMSSERKFSLLVKRAIAWEHPELNEFGLMSCEELGFVVDGKREIVDLGGHRQVRVQQFRSNAEYQRASVAAKDLQTRSLIHALEKSLAVPQSDTTHIPFCFSDIKSELWHAV